MVENGLNRRTRAPRRGTRSVISRRSIVFVVVLFLSSLTLTACDDDGQPAAQAPATGDPMELTSWSTTSSTAADAATDKVDAGRRRGHRRRARVLQPAAGDRGEDRLPVLQRLAAAALEVPDPRAVGRRRSLRPHRGAARIRGGVLQHHLDYVEYGPKLLRHGEVRRGRDRDRERGAHVVDWRPARHMARAHRPGLSRVPHRRLQPAVQPGLHRGDDRHARRRRRGRAVAGE